MIAQQKKLLQYRWKSNFNIMILMKFHLSTSMLAGPNKDRTNKLKLKTQLVREFEMKDDIAHAFNGTWVLKGLGMRGDFTVRGYVDSDYACDLDGKNQPLTRYVFILSGRTVRWVSKLYSVLDISTEAAYAAAD
ncbi:hypothetical protein Tco_0403785 [Tanacetum coccineum]